MVPTEFEDGFCVYGGRTYWPDRFYDAEMDRLVISDVILVPLSAVLTLAAGVIAAAFLLSASQNQAVWATIAAGLAVITSIFSAWTAQRVLEIEEDSKKPFPYPSFDISSRFGLAQLRVTNYGGRAAHKVNIVWDKPLLNRKGQHVAFAGSEAVSDIPVLLPNESVAVMVDSTMSIFQEGSGFEMNYTGKVEFEDPSGRASSYPFFISLEQYRHSMTHDTEQPKTLRELQRIPEELRKIRQQLERLQV